MVTKTVTPVAASSRMRSQKSRRLWMSTPAVGSSRKRTRGWCSVLSARPRALADAGGEIARLSCSTSASANRSRSSPQRSLERRRRPCRRGRRRTRGSRAARAPGRGSPSGPCTRCDRARGAASLMTSMPSTSIVPAVGVSRPISMRMVVLLPEPFAPRNAKIAPGATSKSRSSTAVKSPKRLVSPRARMIGHGPCWRSLSAPCVRLVVRAPAPGASPPCRPARARRSARRRVPRASAGTATGPGVAALGTSMRAKSPLAWVSATHGRSARRARDRVGVVAPGAIELDGDAGAELAPAFRSRPRGRRRGRRGGRTPSSRRGSSC